MLYLMQKFLVSASSIYNHAHKLSLTDSTTTSRFSQAHSFLTRVTVAILTIPRDIDIEFFPSVFSPSVCHAAYCVETLHHTFFTT